MPKSRIRSADQAHKVTQALEATIRDLVDHVRRHHLPIEDLTRLWVDRRAERGYLRLPYHSQRYLDGYYRACWEALWNAAEWRIFYRGAYVSSSAAIEPGTYNEVDTEKSQHFWPGSDAPFTRKLERS